jgi:hypothetical protein
MTCARTAAGALLTLITVLIVPASARAGPLDLYYERALMSAADARCRLFAPDTAAALAAAQAQARGAALRDGASDAAVLTTAAAASARAAATPCSSSQLKIAAGRVQAAFQGYGRLLRMDFPGDVAGWRADRSLPARASAWRLAQTPAGSALTFGLAGRWSDPQALIAVAEVGEGDEPYAARLLVRDVARAPEPYLNQVRAGSTAKLPLWARTPPRFASLVFAAETRGAPDAGLSPPGAGAAVAFRFPPAAAEAIAALDPREAVTIELLYAGRTGDLVRKAYVEVGDFAAGRAFLASAKR